MPTSIASGLRRAAVIAATLFYTLTPSTGGGAVTAAAIGLTAATIVTASDAEARPQVRDHRTGVNKKPKLPTGR